MESVAELVEKVASVAEKVSSEVADVLPEDSKLKDAAQLVEYVSKEAEKDAHLILKLIHKVQVLISHTQYLFTKLMEIRNFCYKDHQMIFKICSHISDYRSTLRE